MNLFDQSIGRIISAIVYSDIRKASLQIKKKSEMTLKM